MGSIPAVPLLWRRLSGACWTTTTTRMGKCPPMAGPPSRYPARPWPGRSWRGGLAACLFPRAWPLPWAMPGRAIPVRPISPSCGGGLLKSTGRPAPAKSLTSGTAPSRRRGGPMRRERSYGSPIMPTPWRPSGRPMPPLSTPESWPGRSTRTAGSSADISGMRTWRPTRPSGWSRSPWTTGAIRSARSRPTARALRLSWPSTSSRSLPSPRRTVRRPITGSWRP